MQYAIQTRDYNNDYRWSWEARGRDNPLAKVSLELQRLIRDGEKGVAVSYKNGKFHVIFSAIDTLGDKPIGQDFSKASIRMSIVFADISQEQAKGLVQYYIANRANPGKEFQGIVTWDTNSWETNEAKIQEAFQRIKPIPVTGKKLRCQDGNGAPTDWFDYDMSDETEGPKLVIQGVQLALAADPIPEPTPEVAPQTKEPGRKGGSCLLYICFVMLILGLAVETYIMYNTNQKLTDANDERTDTNKKLTETEKRYNTIENQLKNVTRERDSANEERDSANEERNSANEERDKAKKELETANNNLGTAQNNLQKAQESRNVINAKLEEYKKFENSLLELAHGTMKSFELPLCGKNITITRNTDPSPNPQQKSNDKP